jgi:polyisoprenoid-binding protein YceI
MKGCILCFVLVFFGITVTQAAQTTYLFDVEHTYVLWQIDHFGFSKQAGKFYADGSLVLDETKPENSKVNAVIQTANINTGIKKLDDYLRGELFFCSRQIPHSNLC